MSEVTATERAPGSASKAMAVVTLLALALYVVAGGFYLIFDDVLLESVAEVVGFIVGGGGPVAT